MLNSLWNYEAGEDSSTGPKCIIQFQIVNTIHLHLLTAAFVTAKGFLSAKHKCKAFNTTTKK